MPRTHGKALSLIGSRRAAALVLTALAALLVYGSGLAQLDAAAESATTHSTKSQTVTSGAPADPAARARLDESFGKLPLQFEVNRGQADARVKFLARGRGYNLFLTPTEAVLALRNSDCGLRNEGDAGHLLKTDAARSAANPQSAICHPQSSVLRMSLSGANTSPAVSGADELAGKSNYFVGKDARKWRAGVETFARVKYAGVYDGVDLVYYGNQGQLEYDFHVAPGADPRRIRLAFDGADDIKIDDGGALVLRVAGREVRQHKPFVYQTVGGARREVAGAYVLLGGREVGFRLGEYDAALPLVIDPVLVYSTYLGGSGSESAHGVAFDPQGNIYVTGLTDSFDFPVTPGALQTTRRPLAGTQIHYGDAYVMKLNPSGSSIIYATYIGGSVGGEITTGIDVDAEGNAYVSGNTGGGATASGYTNDFPTTPGAFDTTPDSYDCPFVLKLNPSGSALVYSTYLGAGSAGRLALDKATGEVFVIGATSSPNFPTTPGALKTEIQNGEGDGFVTKLNAAGSGLAYSTYLGGNGAGDSLGDIAIDAEGNAYIAGSTGSLYFPVTPNAAQPVCGQCQHRVADAFYVKLNPTGSQLLYSTYLGGSQSESGSGIALDGAGNVYLAGATASGASSVKPFPLTPGAMNNTANGSGGAYVAKYNSAGAVVYAAIIGIGSVVDVAADSAGNTYVTGETISRVFPVVEPFSHFITSGNHVFISALNPSATALTFSTIFGKGEARHIVYDGAGSVYVAGRGTAELPLAKPLKTSPFELSGPGGSAYDAFVAKLAVSGPGATPARISGQVVTTDGTSHQGINIRLSGSQTGMVLTDAEGRYSFPVRPGGTYTVEGVREDLNFAPRTQTFENITADRQAETIYSSINYRPEGYISSPTEGAVYTAPATILLKAEASDRDGSIQRVEFYNNDQQLLFVDTEAPYEFEWKNVPAKSEQWSVSANIYDNTGKQGFAIWRFFTVNPAATPTPTPATPAYHTISGRLTDQNGAPIINAFVNVYGPYSATKTTDADGRYSFNLEGGAEHTIMVYKEGYEFDQTSKTFENLSAPQTADFGGAQLGSPLNVGGRVVHYDGKPAANVRVRLHTSDPSGPLYAKTDADGRYLFKGAPAGGQFMVTADDAYGSYSFEPGFRSYEPAVKHISGADFVCTRLAYYITGQVTVGGAARAGVTVTLAGGQAGDTLTGEDGRYAFYGLAGGTAYTVTPYLEGYTFTPAPFSTAGLTDDVTADFSAAAAAGANWVNHALASNGGVASASSQYNASFPVAAMTDGDRRSLRMADGRYNIWHSAAGAKKPDWVQVEFAGPRAISQLNVVTQQDDYNNPVAPTDALTFQFYGLRDFEAQFWNGSQWATIPGAAVTGNDRVIRRLAFAPLTTTKVRVLITGSADGFSRVMELEALGEPATAPRPQNRRNVALAANGGVATASSQLNASFPVAAVVNGDRQRLYTSDGKYNLWHGASKAKPDWVEVAFAGAKVIDEVSVYTQQDDYNNAVEPTEATTFTQFGLRDFDVQYWDGAQWATVPGGAVTGNDKVWRKFTFPAVTTTRVRLLVRGAADGYSRVWELEAWGTDTPTPARMNVAAAANGATATASSQLNASFPVAAAINGDRHRLLMSDGRYNIWHSAAHMVKPDWLEVAFAGPKTISEVGVVTQQDDYNSPVEPTEATTFTKYGLRDFEVQHWDGSAWATIPGAAVTGNDRVMRRFTFAPLTTTKIRVLVRTTADGFTRIMEVEALTP